MNLFFFLDCFFCCCCLFCLHLTDSVEHKGGRGGGILIKMLWCEDWNECCSICPLNEVTDVAKVYFWNVFGSVCFVTTDKTSFQSFIIQRFVIVFKRVDCYTNTSDFVSYHSFDIALLSHQHGGDWWWQMNVLCLCVFIWCLQLNLNLKTLTASQKKRHYFISTIFHLRSNLSSFNS